MKRKIIIHSLICCLVLALALGSLAYFTGFDSLKKTYMVTSNASDLPVNEDDFSMWVYQTVGSTENKTETVEGKTFTSVYPGGMVEMDPSIRNTGKYGQWVRLKVTFSSGKAWEKALARTGISMMDTVFKDVNRSLWKYYADAEYNNADDTYTYTFYLDKELLPGKSETLLKTLSIPAEFGSEDMKSLAYFTVSISGDAIQSFGTGNSAKEAFDKYWS